MNYILKQKFVSHINLVTWYKLIRQSVYSFRGVAVITSA